MRGRGHDQDPLVSSSQTRSENGRRTDHEPPRLSLPKARERVHRLPDKTQISMHISVKINNKKWRLLDALNISNNGFRAHRIWRLAVKKWQLFGLSWPSPTTLHLRPFIQSFAWAGRLRSPHLRTVSAITQRAFLGVRRATLVQHCCIDWMNRFLFLVRASWERSSRRRGRTPFLHHTSGG